MLVSDCNDIRTTVISSVENHVVNRVFLDALEARSYVDNFTGLHQSKCQPSDFILTGLESRLTQYSPELSDDELGCHNLESVAHSLSQKFPWLALGDCG